MVRMQVLAHKDSRSETQDYSHVTDREVIAAIRKAMPDLRATTVVLEATTDDQDLELENALQKLQHAAENASAFHTAVLTFAKGCG